MLKHQLVKTLTVDSLASLLRATQLAELDLFNCLELESAVKICRRALTLSEAGRKLFGAPRESSQPHKRC